ncbi:MAG: hypothetical protein IH975_04630 [Nitrospinae bacterium]|nr:hypothetical protein [Nitrospinota bacterium]
MARKLKICNLRIGQSFIKPFSIEGYHFEPTSIPKKQSVITHKTIARDQRRHQVTATGIIPQKQSNSILYSGGEIRIESFGGVVRRRKRKFIEDLLLILSILTGNNVCLHSHRYNREFPVITENHLDCVSSLDLLSSDLLKAVNKVKDRQWQREFHNGFHLRMLFNNANILNLEGRFLSNMVLWELLYVMIKMKESFNHREIVAELLSHFWPNLRNSNIFSRGSYSLLTILRNQLAHSGKLPIDRERADPWMTQLSFEAVKEYILLFNQMTQAMVLQTLSIDATSRNAAFQIALMAFLRTGQVAYFHS